MMEAPKPSLAIPSAPLVSESLAWVRREAAAGLDAASCFESVDVMPAASRSFAMMPLRSTFLAASMTAARSLLATFSMARMPAGAVMHGLGAGEGENEGAEEGETEADGVGSAVGVAFEQPRRT